MIRRLGAVGLCVAFQAAALWAPFVHAHPDDHETDHHHARAIHAHLSQHPGPAASEAGPAIGQPDHDRALFLQVFVTEAAAPFDAAAVAVPIVDTFVPGEMPAHPSLDAVNGRDPPDIRSIASRAPPTFLS